jgi:hypothetical protein
MRPGCLILTATILRSSIKASADRILFTKVGQLPAGSKPLDLVLLSRPIQNISIKSLQIAADREQRYRQAARDSVAEAPRARVLAERGGVETGSRFTSGLLGDLQYSGDRSGLRFPRCDAAPLSREEESGQ